MLAQLEGFEHLAAQPDDRLRALEGTASIVGDRIIGEAAGESIPVAIVERRGITNQDIVDRIAIEEVLQSGVQELLRHLFLCGPNEIVDSRKAPKRGPAIDQQVLSGDEARLVGG